MVFDLILSIIMVLHLYWHVGTGIALYYAMYEIITNEGDERMKIISIETGETLGEVETNHSMDIYEACRFAGIMSLITPDINGESDYDAEGDLEMVY